MKLSILIPTHNRPRLFERCLNSVLSQLPADVEIIVNNDSNDIVEIKHPRVEYHYQKFSNLGQIYQFLYNRAAGEYVYFLEDDDYLASNFFQRLALDADLICGNYMPTYNPDFILACSTVYKTGTPTVTDFISTMDVDRLQLGQYVFKRSTIKDFHYPWDNNIHNDIRLVLHAAGHAQTIKTLTQIFYYQTTDGKDNLSFPESASTVNTTKSLEFLSDYGLNK